MANKVVKYTCVRWWRRYWVFVLLVFVILIIQIILALSFYGLYSGPNELELAWETTNRKAKSGRPVNPYSQRGSNEDYLLEDDEDSPSNLFEHGNGSQDHGAGSKKSSDPQQSPNLDTAFRLPSSHSSSHSQYNNRTLTDGLTLNLDELDFKPWCNISGREAISAIQRASTQKCKQELANLTCLSHTGNLYPDRLPRYCHLDIATSNKSLGCFRDSKRDRLLSKQKSMHPKDNSPQRCVDACLQSGFLFAGVQFSVECFCGNKEPPSESRLTDQGCDLACPNQPQLTCGGYLAMNIYRTGLSNHPKPSPAKLPSGSEWVTEPRDARIVFLMTVNGRAVRQVKRLINSLYSFKHYFYIHVDSRQDYLYRELLPLEKELDNVRLSRTRLSTIWGGASLLKMLLQCMQELLDLKHWHWDYLLNLSESDFPIKSVSKLEAFLTVNKGMNFVKSHGQDTLRFIAKQGLDKSFYECDTHMWRLGERKLPAGVRMDGGSDWVALHRDFVSYVVRSKDPLVSGLRTLFSYTLLPAESFFHTVLQNSKFCDKVVDNNLHVTNWKRKQGCRCQYKHIVDWCGCSPNDFKEQDWPRLQATEERPFFFARKFEPSIDQSIIDHVEAWILPEHRLDEVGSGSYWQSEYDSRDTSPRPDDAFLTAYHSFARLGLRQLSHCISNQSNISAPRVLETNLYFSNDAFKGLLVLYEVPEFPSRSTKRGLLMESQVRPIMHYTVHRPQGPTGALSQLQVGSDFDAKEQVLRNWAGILGPFSPMGALHAWGPVASTFPVTFVWLDPTNTVAGSYEVKIDPAPSQVQFHKPSFRHPLRPGLWTLRLMYQWTTSVAETRFLVLPLSFYFGRPISADQAPFLNGGPGQAYVEHDFSNVEALLGRGNRSALTRQAQANSRRFGRDLDGWVDSLTSGFWAVQSTCYVSQPRHPVGGAVCVAEIDPCHLTPWSSKTPDPKSTIKQSGTGPNGLAPYGVSSNKKSVGSNGIRPSGR